MDHLGRLISIYFALTLAQASIALAIPTSASRLNGKLSAPGQPGITPNWSSAKKVQIGTSYCPGTCAQDSLVWFTNADGILTETYYPSIDKAQIKDAQILVTDHRRFFRDEKKRTKHSVQVLSPSLVKLINEDTAFKFKIEHTFYTLSDSSTLIDEVVVESFEDGLHFYLLVNSAIENTGYKDSAKVTNEGLLFFEQDTTLQVYSSVGFTQKSVGYVGQSDGYQDLYQDRLLNLIYDWAPEGNVAGTGKINIPALKGRYKFYIIYDFSGRQDFSTLNLAQAKDAYETGWKQYLSHLDSPQDLSPTHDLLYRRSLYTMKVHEDKLKPGAITASLSKPWGEELRESPGVFTGGYHLIWPRDLSHIGQALTLAGDLETPLNALRFLKSIQYQSGVWHYGTKVVGDPHAPTFEMRLIKRKGAFPQNVWTNGTPYWNGFQIDQVGHPVLLFYQLYRKSNTTQKKHLLREFRGMLYEALQFIETYGPWTAQERWEENFGISPSSFSVITAALLIGEKLFPQSSFGDTARLWLNKPQDNIDTWTFTERGFYGDGRHYIRIAGCADHTAPWLPNEEMECIIANSGQKVDQRSILDQGFLKLALLGLRPGSDEKIKTSNQKVQQYISVETPRGIGHYRYSYDAYGEFKKGRLWPLLSGEQGRYAIERATEGDLPWNEALAQTEQVLDSFLGFSNEGMMIPEQVFEDTGLGTGGATPLSWSHAEYVKLLWSRALHKNVENMLE